MSTPVPGGKELIRSLITNKLIAEQAAQRGLAVSDDELQAEISRQRGTYKQLKPSTDEEKQIAELMANRIRITGLSDDEFWQSDATKET